MAKLPYEKPEMVIERFELTQSIGANCEVKANFAEGECGAAYRIWENAPIFTRDVDGCITKSYLPYVSIDGDLLYYDSMHPRFNVFNS